MTALKWIWAWIYTQYEGVKYRKDKDKVRENAAMMKAKFPVPMNPPYPPADPALFPPHTGYTAHLQKSIASLHGYKRGEYPVSMGMMDSLLDMARGWIDAVPSKWNFSLGGMRTDHGIQFLDDILPVMRMVGFVPYFILLGSPGGNDLLQRYDVHGTISRFEILFNKIRAAFPLARICVYDLPQTIIDYMIVAKPIVTDAVKKIVLADGNATLLLLVQNFTKKNRALPKSDMSVEGVHMTALGMMYFNEDIHDGFFSAPGSIIP